MTFAADLLAIVDPLVASRAYTAETVPNDAAFPYISILMEPFETLPALDGDAKTLVWRRLCQVDLWETVGGEDEALTRNVRAALNGAQMSDPRYRLRVQSIVRVPEPDPASQVVHRTITVEACERE